MKVIKLLPKNVSKYWGSIKTAIEDSIEPMIKANPENMLNVQLALMEERMQCWAIHDDKEIFGYIVTLMSTEPITQEKSLIIYAFFLDKRVDDISIWHKGMKALNEFAKENQCKKIEAYSINDNVISIAKKIGFTSDYSYMVKEV